MKIKVLVVFFLCSIMVGAFGTLISRDYFREEYKKDQLSKTNFKSFTNNNDSIETIIESAAAIMFNTDKELILDSNLIVEAELIKFNESKWSNPDYIKGKDKINIIQTDVIFKVNNVLYGEDITSEVVLRIDEGLVDGALELSDYTPQFHYGEKILLFLRRDTNESLSTVEDYYILTGATQGTYYWQNDKYVSAFDKSRFFDVAALSEMIKKEREQNPDWDEQRREYLEQAKINNIKTIGE